VLQLLPKPKTSVVAAGKIAAATTEGVIFMAKQLPHHSGGSHRHGSTADETKMDSANMGAATGEDVTRRVGEQAAQNKQQEESSRGKTRSLDNFEP
jgi:hypothetical protein